MARRQRGIPLLPSPHEIEAYEAAWPGMAERVLGQVEAQAEHDRELERVALNAEIADAKAQRAETRRGQVFGLILGLAGLGSASVIMRFAPNASGATAASIVGGGTLVSMVFAFVTGKAMPPKEPGPPPGTATGTKPDANH